MNAKYVFAALAAFVLTASAPFSRATPTGLPSPDGEALWDTGFSSINFTDLSPTDFEDTSLYTLTLSSSMAGGMILGSGSRIYSGSGATPNAFNLTIDGVANDFVTTFTLVLKYTSPAGATLGDSASVNHFTVALDGNEVSSVLYGTSVGDTGGDFNVVTWTWNNLDYNPTDTFQVSVVSAADHVSLDAIQAVQVVPEPSAAALFGLGTGLALWIRRRRRTA